MSKGRDSSHCISGDIEKWKCKVIKGTPCISVYYTLPCVRFISCAVVVILFKISGTISNHYQVPFLPTLVARLHQWHKSHFLPPCHPSPKISNSKLDARGCSLTMQKNRLVLSQLYTLCLLWLIVHRRSQQGALGAGPPVDIVGPSWNDLILWASGEISPNFWKFIISNAQIASETTKIRLFCSKFSELCKLYKHLRKY